MNPQLPDNCPRLDCLTKLDDIHAALLGGTFEHPEGLVHQVKRHGITLYGDDGKSGLVAACEDIKTVKVISRFAWVIGGILIAVFGNTIGTWVKNLLIR
jgi:hypothetical protein